MKYEIFKTLNCREKRLTGGVSSCSFFIKQLFGKMLSTAMVSGVLLSPMNNSFVHSRTWQ